MRNVCLQTYRNNRICKKVAYFLRKIQTLRVNNSIIPRTKNTKFSEYYFYLTMNLYGEFQICISVPLIIRRFNKNQPQTVIFISYIGTFSLAVGPKTITLKHSLLIKVDLLSWKQWQCPLPVITTVALWQLMHLGIWCTIQTYIMCPSDELTQSFCGDNQEGTLFSW